MPTLAFHVIVKATFTEERKVMAEYYDPELDGEEIQEEKKETRPAETNNKLNTCPLCSKKLNFLNKSFKVGGQWICNECAPEATAILGQGRWSYKNVSIEKLKKDIKNLRKQREKAALSEPKTYGSAPDFEITPKKACCPKCHSQAIMPMGHKHKNVSLGKAAAGVMIFGGIGVAAGMLGKTEKKVEFYCTNCGNVFKR